MQLISQNKRKRNKN